MEENLAYSIHDDAFRSFTCSTCHMEITSPTMHGWVRTGDYGAHTGWKSRIEPCPDCSDSARARRITSQVDRLLGQSRIPLRMAEWSFSSIPIDVDDTAKKRAIFFANKRSIMRGIYFYGNLGVGKTGLAISIIQTAIRRGEDALFIRSLDLMNRLRESIHRGTDEGDEILQLVKSITWLALDDLATERPTDYVIEQLKAIVEARMDGGKYTIFTSNFSLKDLEVYWRPEGVQAGSFYPGRRVIDRVGEYVEGVKLEGRNLRRKEAK